MSLPPKTRRALATLPIYLLTIATAALAQGSAPVTGAMPEWIEKGGFAAMCGYIVWWMTTKLSSSIDKLSDRIGGMIERQDHRDHEMTAAFKDMRSSFDSLERRLGEK